MVDDMQGMVATTMVVVMVTIQATTRDTLVLVEGASTGAGIQIILFQCTLVLFPFMFI
jgi:hypothetical protein